MSVNIVADKCRITGANANERLLELRKETLETFRGIILSLGLVRVDQNGNHNGWSIDNSVFPYGYVYECFTYPKYRQNPEDAPYYLTLTMRSRSWSGDYLGNVVIGITTSIYSDGTSSYVMSPSIYDGFYYKNYTDGDETEIQYAKRYAILTNSGGAKFYVATGSNPSSPSNISGFSWGTLPVKVDQDPLGGSVQIARWGGNSEIDVYCDDGSIRRLTYGLLNYTSSQAIKGGNRILTIPTFLTSVMGETYTKAQIEVPKEALKGYLPNADFSSYNGGAKVGQYMTVNNIAIPY